MLSVSLSERVWRRLLLDPKVRAAPFSADLTTRPVTTTMVAPREADSVRLGALGCLVAIAALFGLMAIIDGLWLVGAVATLLLSIALFIGVLLRRAGRMEWRATWHADRVDVVDGRWATPRSRTLPLAEFEAVELRSIVVARASALAISTSYTLHLAELRHPDPLQSLLLASNRFSEPSRTAGQRTAAALSVPIIDHYSAGA